MGDAVTSSKNRKLQGLVEQNARLRGQLALLSRIGRRLSSSLDVRTVLQETVEAACELTGARYGALAVFGASGRIEQFLTHGITPRDRERIGSLPKGTGLLGWLRRSRTPLRLADLSRHPQFAGFPPNHPQMKTFLGTPIRYRSQALGSLYLTEKVGGREFTPEDEEMLALFVVQAAVAVRNAHLHQQVEMERQRLDVILNDSPNGMIYVDKATGEVQANPQAQEMLGCLLRPEDGIAPLEGKWFRPDGTLLPRQALPLREALEGKRIAGEEHLIIRSDGRHIPILSSASPIRDPEGRVVGAVVRFRDMTSVKEAQRQIEEMAAERGRLLEAAQREHKRLEVLVDTSPVGVLVVDAASNRVVLLNREGERIFRSVIRVGDTAGTLAQSVWFRRADGREFEPEELPLRRALYRGETVRAEELHIEFLDGHAVPTLVDAAPVYSTDGQITGAIAIIQDITPLEELEKLRSEFLGMVSHELKTPLTAIKGSAATALGSKRPVTPEETRELFEIIDEQADRLRDTVDNILDMSRIEAGSLSVTTEPTDLRAILEGATAAFARGGGSQKVTISLPDGLPQVKADQRRILQVMSNLLSNAAKFSPGEAPITIRVESDAQQVTVHVKDRGRGIPKEKLPHLFRKFSQVHADKGHRLAGSGLGLAICKGIVQTHGGRIWVDSPGKGQGATFSFTLPVAAPAPTTPGPDTSRSWEHLGKVRRPGERARVLAVDDEPRLLLLLQRTLEEAGYHALVTTDPTQVTKLIEMEEPDLVLMDLLLLGTSGFDLLQRIREFSGVPVIFLTVSDQSEDTVKALRMGADDYITKPFSPSELLARIEAAMRRRVLPDTIEARPPFVRGNLTINFAQRSVTVGGRLVSLSATEYKVLYELATNAGRVLTHNQILQRVWGPAYQGETELVRAFIRNLRRKLGDDARNPRYVFTEPQVGYRMPAP